MKQQQRALNKIVTAPRPDSLDSPRHQNLLKPPVGQSKFSQAVKIATPTKLESCKKSNSSSSFKKDKSCSDLSNFQNLLEDIDGVIDKEITNTKDIQKDLNIQKKTVAKTHRLSEIAMTEKICFSEKEKKDLIRGFNEDRKNMFTSSGSGQEYFQKKVLKKIDNL